jgi:steroid delta-isomerase-like uncharacterized protein
MKLVATLAFALALPIAMSGCSRKKPEEQPDRTPPPQDNPTPKPNEGSGSAKPALKSGNDLAALYSGCIAAINEGKLDEFKTSCLAAKYVGHEMDGDTIPNADAAVGTFKQLRTGFPDMRLEPQLVLVEGRNIFGVLLFTGTHTGAFTGPDGPLPATNKKVGFTFFHRLAMDDDNRAAEEWEYSDARTFLKQLGVNLDPAPARPAIETHASAFTTVVAADNAAEKANLETIKKATDAFNAHKLADTMAFYADDARSSDHAEAKDEIGKKEIEKGMASFWKAFSDGKVEIQNTFAAGDYIVALGTFTGTNDGPLGPIPATKTKVTSTYAEVFKLSSGKIVEVQRFRNGLALAKAMGLIKTTTKDAPPKDAPAKDAAAKAKDAPAKDAPAKDAPAKDAPKAPPAMAPAPPPAK